MERVERLESVVAQLRAGESGALRAGVSPDVPAGAVAAVVRRLARDHPDVAVIPVEQSAPELVAALIDRRIDLALVRRPLDDALLRTGPPISRPLGALVSERDALASAPAIELALIDAGSALVLFPRESAPVAHDAIVATCHALGFAPRELLAAASVDFAASLVLTAPAVALLEEPAVVPPGTAWRPLAGAPLEISASVAWRLGDDRAIVRLVAGILRDVLVDGGGWAPVAPTAPRGTRPRPADSLLA